MLEWILAVVGIVVIMCVWLLHCHSQIGKLTDKVTEQQNHIDYLLSERKIMDAHMRYCDGHLSELREKNMVIETRLFALEQKELKPEEPQYNTSIDIYYTDEEREYVNSISKEL